MTLPNNPSLKMSLVELAAAMRLTGGPTEMIKPLNVGLMFFNEKPDSFSAMHVLRSWTNRTLPVKEWLKKIFTTMTSDLEKLKAWLLDESCTKVVMESSGKHWIPVHNILEDSILF